MSDALEEYELASAEAVYKYPGEQAPMRFVAPGGESNESRNASNWLDQKQLSFTRPNLSENTNWETTAVCTSVAEEAIRKETRRVNTTEVLGAK